MGGRIGTSGTGVSRRRVMQGAALAGSLASAGALSACSEEKSESGPVTLTAAEMLEFLYEYSLACANTSASVASASSAANRTPTSRNSAAVCVSSGL